MPRTNQNRMPKEQYFLMRFMQAHEQGRTAKAAYFKARYENESGAYLSSSIGENYKYESYISYDKHPNYKANKR